jgi:uncharacterized protein YkwD
MRLTLILWLTLLFAPLNSMVLANEGGVRDISAQALNIVNDYREANGLHRLTLNKRLSATAAVHARNMSKYDFFAHNGPGRSTPGRRARSQGYQYCHIAENLAKGQKSLDVVMRDWINSPSHRRNLLDRRVQEFSLVRAPGDIWVMEMGVRGACFF